MAKPPFPALGAVAIGSRAGRRRGGREGRPEVEGAVEVPGEGYVEPLLRAQTVRRRHVHKRGPAAGVCVCVGGGL